MLKKLLKITISLLLIVFLFTMTPCLCMADGDEPHRGTVSGNEPGENVDDPKNIVVDEDTYKLNFVPNNPEGTQVSGTMEPQSFLMEQTANISKNLFEIPGYLFTGWNTLIDGSGTAYLDEQEVSCLSAVKDEVINLYAQWEIITYKISYELNGGSLSSVNPATYTYYTADIILSSPVKTGYTFLGWYKESNLVTKVEKIALNSSGDYKLYAGWRENKYSVRLDANGGSGSMSKMTNLSYGKKYNITRNTYTAVGKVFAGWNTKADGSGTQYIDGGAILNLSIADGSETVLYAQWKYIEYQIEYKLNGGSNNVANPATYTVATAKITLKKPTRAGYTFKGWYSDSKFKKKITEIDTSSKKKITVYAKWEENTYNIKFSANGGKGKMSKITKIKFTQKVKLPAATYTRTGYTFLGWNTKKDGSGTSYSDKQKVKKVYGKAGTVTLYAQWKPITYTIKFNGNGATGGSTAKMKNLSYGETYKLNANGFLRAGYVFAGWNTKKSGSGTQYSNKAKISNLTTENKTVIILYARWKRQGSSEEMSDEDMYNFFLEEGMTDCGAAALMGNLFAESALISTNLQNTYNIRLGMSDDEYTAAVDNGSYTNFANDSAGYGLAQWTSSGRKSNLLQYARSSGTSIGDRRMQVEYLMTELRGKYSGVLNVLMTANSIKVASNEVLFNFEAPRNQGPAVQTARANYSIRFYNLYSGHTYPAEEDEPMSEEDCPFTVRVETTELNIRSGPGTNYSKVGSIGSGEYEIIHVSSGNGSNRGWGQLSDGRGWISLDYVSRVN